MTSGFAWLNELMAWLGRWFPRLVLVKAAHQAVWVGPGGRTKQWSPGLYCYWPITSDVVVVSQRERSTELAAQLIGDEVIAIAVVWVVTSAERLLLQVNDIFASLDDGGQAALAASVSLGPSLGDIEQNIVRLLRHRFEPLGVDVRSVSVLQRGGVLALKNLNDWAQHGKAELC
jgi:regulator of protease activity HflC (stomatin/prohibitin superfamily)